MRERVLDIVLAVCLIIVLAAAAVLVLMAVDTQR